MKKIDKGNKTMTTATFNIQKDLRIRFKIQATRDGKTMNAIFIKWVEEYLKEAEKNGRA